MKVKEFEEYLVKRRKEFAKKFGQEINELGQEEGLKIGSPDAEVTGILVTWMMTKEAMAEAAKQKCSLILCHETPWFGDNWNTKNPSIPLWRVNNERKDLALENSLNVIQCHSTLDEILITDTFGEFLGLPKPSIQAWRLINIYDIPALPLKKLADQVKKKTGLKTIRVTGNMNRKVSKVGLIYGGIGLSINLGFWEGQLKWNPEVLIAGEMDEYAMRYAIDNYICAIETTHPVSEEPGLEKFCEELKQDLPGMKVAFHKVGMSWNYV